MVNYYLFQPRENLMKLNAPKKNTWLVAVIVGVAGIIINYVPAYSSYGFWLVAIAFVLLALATYLKGF